LVVFDFDKTLTYDDTLYGFYKEIGGNHFLFPVKRLLLFLSAIMFKLNIISNDHLKRVGVWLFLKGRSRFEIDRAASIYATKIKLNKIYQEIFLKKPCQTRLVVSASYEEYLKYIFPEDQVIGAQLNYDNNVVKGLKRNMFGSQKSEFLEAKGNPNIDEFYTDSYTDLPLMNISNKNFLVQGDKIFEL
jgi:phosphoserine phosphatase